jgi:TonB family protein
MSTSPTTKPQSSATQVIYRWTFPGAPIRIDLPIDLISRLRAELGQRESSGCSEVGGVLLGQRITRRTVRINDYLWISGEKPGTRYHLDPSALERLREERSAREEDAVRSGVVGYFRTQARDDLQLRDDEIRLVREHLQNPTDVVLLIRTSDKPFTSGFFFWMREGEFAPVSLKDFPLDAGLLHTEESRTPATEPAAAEQMPRLLPPITDQDATSLAEPASSPGAERIPTPDGSVSPNPRLRSHLEKRQEHQGISNAHEQVNRTQRPDTTPIGTVVASKGESARVSPRKLVSAAALFGLLAVVSLCAFLLRDRWSTGPKRKPPATVAALPLELTVAEFPLQLYVEARGDDLNVRWNPKSAPITEARDGRLVILEGDQQPPRIIPLNLQQLTSGHVYYRSSAERLQFQLEIVDHSGGVSRESVLALSATSAVVAPRSSPPLEGNPQAAAKKVLSIPIPSANAGALPRANTTEAPPKGPPAPRVFMPPSSGGRTLQLPTITFEPPTTQTVTVPPEAVVLPATLSNLPANVPLARQVKKAPVAKQIVVANLQTADPIKRVMPVYPPMAREQRIQGTVRFIATISKDGRVKNLEFISGNPIFVKAATDALKQWLYRPALQNGEPVEMTTQIDLNFTFKP